MSWNIAIRSKMATTRVGKLAVSSTTARTWRHCCSANDSAARGTSGLPIVVSCRPDDTPLLLNYFATNLDNWDPEGDERPRGRSRRHCALKGGMPFRPVC
jgi:hypothetical protein